MTEGTFSDVTAHVFAKYDVGESTVTYTNEPYRTGPTWYPVNLEPWFYRKF